MRRSIIFLIWFLLIPITTVRAQGETADITGIISPRNGDVIQGIISIEGTFDTEGFQSFILEFKYSTDTSNTWFFVHQSEAYLENTSLFQWDTNRLTDGNYDLRLSISAENNDQFTYVVEDLRIRNYTPIESNTPRAITPTVEFLNNTLLVMTSQTVVNKGTPTPLIREETEFPLTQTPKPNNPAMITDEKFSTSLMLGVALTFLLFLIIGIYSIIKKILFR